MNWLAMLGIAVVIVAVAALTGIKPKKGTRSIAHSRLMTMGRIILVLIVVIFAWMAFHARFGV